jgi:hypothetical protein
MGVMSVSDPVEGLQSLGLSDAEVGEVEKCYRLAGYSAEEINALDIYKDQVSVQEILDDLEDRDEINSETLISGDFDWDIKDFGNYLPIVLTYFDDVDVYDVGERFLGFGKPKNADYWFRNEPILERELSREEREELAQEFAGNCEGGVERAFTQYFNEFGQKLHTASDAYWGILDLISGQDRHVNRLSASTPLTELGKLPEYLQDQIPETDDVVNIEGIFPRLRGINRTGGCNELEELHYETFLDDPSKETILIEMEGNLIGSLKLIGDRTMMGLQNVKSGGRFPIWKGMVYQLPHEITNDLKADKRIEGCPIAELEELPISPKRRIGSKHHISTEPDTTKEFREAIEDKRTKIEDILR